MSLVELFLIAVGLSMDAFAVSICKGLGAKRLSARQALLVGLYFGGFQALMPLIGWLLGCRFEVLIRSVDHWIAFLALVKDDSLLLRKLYPEWKLQTRLPFWGHSRLYFYCTEHGLFWQNV